MEDSQFQIELNNISLTSRRKNSIEDNSKRPNSIELKDLFFIQDFKNLIHGNNLFEVTFIYFSKDFSTLLDTFGFMVSIWSYIGNVKNYNLDFYFDSHFWISK